MWLSLLPFQKDFTSRLAPDPAFESNKLVFGPGTDMSLRIYVGLLLLTPKVLSLPFDPQDNAFLSWAPSYTAFHNHIIAGSAEYSISSSLKTSHGGFLHFKEKTFFNSVNIFTNNSHLIWWHLTVLRWTSVTLWTLTIDIMWLSTLIIHYLGLMTILLHIRR